MVIIYQPPNAHVRVLGILLSNAMATAAVKKIYIDYVAMLFVLCHVNVYSSLAESPSLHFAFRDNITIPFISKHKLGFQPN
jgi:hypothetical protein